MVHTKGFPEPMLRAGFAACCGQGQAPEQLEAGPGSCWVQAGPPPRVSFPDGFPVFCAEARYRGGVHTRLGVGLQGLQVWPQRRSVAALLAASRAKWVPGSGAVRQRHAQIAAHRKHPDSGVEAQPFPQA